MTLRREILIACVLASFLLLTCNGCAMTEWNRAQDEKLAAFKDLQSPEMNRRIQEARDWK